MIGWVGAYDNTLLYSYKNAKMQLSGSRVKKRSEISNKKKPFEDFNVLNIKHTYIKTVTILHLKLHNLLSAISSEVNTRNTIHNFSLDR